MYHVGVEHIHFAQRNFYRSEKWLEERILSEIKYAGGDLDKSGGYGVNMENEFDRSGEKRIIILSRVTPCASECRYMHIVISGIFPSFSCPRTFSVLPSS